MKRTKKFITIIMLVSILSGFFSPLYVNALTSGDVYNYITNTKTTYQSVKQKIEASKNEEKYNVDKDFKFAVDLIERFVDGYDTTLNENELLLDNKVSLKNLIENYFPEKLEEYSLNFQDDILLDVNTLENIEYTKDENNYTLLTKEEISNVLIENYFKELNDNIVSYNNFYNDKITEYETVYNNLKTKKENTILYINNLINDSKTYKDNELLLGNNPNMEVDNEDVITLLKEKISYLESIVFTIDNYKQLDSKIDDIKNDANRIYNTFKSNNKDYIALGLDVLLNDLNNKYNLVDTTIDKTNYYNLNNISVLKDVVDNENNLVLLNVKIEAYLERRPSDTATINTLLSNINEKRNELNKELAIKYLEEMIDNNDLTEEDNIDKLYELLPLTYINKEIKERIYTIKLSFYDMDIENEDITFEIKGKYFIIDTLIEITKEVLEQNIIYRNLYEIDDDGKFEISIYDKNNVLIRTYEIIIRGDLNNDKNLDYTDIELFRDKLLKNDELDEVDLFKLDFNGDLEVDFEDLMIANNKVNGSEVDVTTTANYVITTTKEDNKIYYTITLKTDNVVTGILFDINISNNLDFDSITYLNDKLKVNDITNPTRIMGLEDFINDERLITLCYEDTKDMEEDSIFSMVDVISYLSNKEKINIKEISNVIHKKVVNVELPKEEEAKVIYVDNSINDDSNNSSNNPSKTPANDNRQDDNKNIEDNKENEENLLPSILKIALIVLLGTLIVYFMNRNEKEEELNFDEEKDKTNQKENK